MGSFFSSSVARSTDYTFNAASDGSAQVGKGSQRSVQGLGNSASGIGTAATGSGQVICSPLMGISGAIQPDVKYGSDTYARRVYWMAEKGELSNPEDLENCLILPGWYQTIDDKLTKNNYHVDEFKKRVQLVVSLGDKDLFFETFFKGKFDLDAIENEIHELDEDLHIEGGDIADVINQEARRLEALRVRAANGDGELPISIFFSQGNENFNNFIGRGFARLGGFEEGWVIHAGLDVGGLRVEWGVGPYSPSLVFPRSSTRAILAKIIVEKQSLFQRFVEGIRHPISTLIEWYYRLREFFLHILGHANQTSLYKIAEVCTSYNRSKFWGPVDCNCEKFVIDVLKTLNLKFAPEGEMKAFIDRINQGDYDLSISDPDGLQTVFNSVLELDGFAEDHWNHLPAWSKYLLCTYNSICSERAQNHARVHGRDAATTESPWIRPASNRREVDQVWRSRVQEVIRLIKP